jgi:hypothetical protein
METFGDEQLPWLKKFFRFKNGTPSHDTFNNVFNLLDPRGKQTVPKMKFRAAVSEEFRTKVIEQIIAHS